MTPEEINEKWPHEPQQESQTVIPVPAPQQNAPVQPEQPTVVAEPLDEKPTKSNKKLLIIIGAVVVLLVLAAVGIFAYMRMQAQKPWQLNDDEGLSFNSYFSIADTKKDEMSDWETFTNDEYNYSVSYPNTWTIEEFPGTLVDSFNLWAPNVGKSGPPAIQFSVSNPFGSKSLFEAENQARSLFEEDSVVVTSVTVDSKEAIKLKGENKNPTGGGDEYRSLIVVDITQPEAEFKNWLMIWFSAAAEEDLNSPVFDQILSTFEFTN